MLITTLAELHNALETAEAGTVVELAPGEYRGPLIITRPITLRGQNRRTVLWRKSGPVVYVRAADVKIEAMLIERTVNSDGPLVVHDPNCTPLGEESMELNDDALINLGELIPGSTVTLPLRLTTNARAELIVTGLHGAQVTPSVLDQPGPHTVILTLDGNAVQRGEVLLGEITLREGGTTRYLWLSGVVLDAVPPDRPICLVANRILLHPSPSGLILDDSALTALGLNTGTTGNQYAVVQKEGTALFLYVPGEPAQPILLNGRPAVRQSRRLLNLQDVIKIGEIAINLQQSEPPPVTLETPIVAFADFDARYPEAAKLTVTAQKTGWRGQVISSVPWLTVAPEGYYRLPPSRPHTWMISLNQGALSLDDGQYDIAGGLMIVGANHALSVDVRLNVRRPLVALQTSPVQIEAVEMGAQVIDLPPVQISVANLGRGDWTGVVKSNVPWLEIITPMPTGGGAWSEAQVQARFLPVWKSLSVGELEFSDALSVATLDEDDKPLETLPIPVKLTITPARGHLRAENAHDSLIVFGDVERNAPLPDTTLALRNDGAAAWVGHARALQGWVGVREEKIMLAAGESKSLAIDLLAIPDDHPLDTPLIIDELQFDAEGDSAPFEGTIRVQLTVVELPPYLAVRPVIFPPFVRGEQPSEALLRIHNQGPTLWQGRIEANIQWLVTPERPVTCEPGLATDVHIGLAPRALEGQNAPLQPGLTTWDAALTITGGRVPVVASVQIDVREAPSELMLETPTLNFGQLNGALSDANVETVRLLNAGTTAWRGDIRLNVNWLSFEGLERSFTLDIPKQSVAEFHVMLNDEALLLPPGVLAQEKALSVVLNNEPRELHVRALLAVSESAPWLAVVPDQLTIRSEKAERLTVHNEGARRWTLNVYATEWLDVSPIEMVLESGQSQAIDVRYMGDHLDESALYDPRAIVIVGPGRESEVAVDVTPKAIRARRAVLDTQARVAAAKELALRLTQQAAASAANPSTEKPETSDKVSGTPPKLNTAPKATGSLPPLPSDDSLDPSQLRITVPPPLPAQPPKTGRLTTSPKPIEPTPEPPRPEERPDPSKPDTA